MAVILKMDSNNANGQKVLNAVEQIRTGLGTLQELNDLRANAIGTSQAEMAAVFGCADEATAQGISDRWGALHAALTDTDNQYYDEFAVLRDFISAISYTTG